MIVKKDIQIFVGNEDSCVKKCPTTIVSNNPCFKWILPKDLEGKQTRFCIQIKAHTPHVLSSGIKDYAFYQSGNVESKLNTFEVNFGTTGLLLQSWRGAIAVRLFISTKPLNEIVDKKMPYEYVSDEAYLSNVDWKDDSFNIKDDTRYFVFDDKSERFTNINDIICRWKNSYDLNNDDLNYYAEICKSPIFDQSDKEVVCFDVKDNQKTFSTIEAKLENDTSYFFRVRSFDGLDYSEWSAVHGFSLTSNTKPVVEITSLEYLENGDVKINFKVSDTQQKRITLRLLYTGGSQKNGIRAVPTLLEPTHFFIITDENEGCGSFTWKSLINEQDDADDFFLYIKANDGIDDSDEFVYGAFSLYNKSIFQRKTSGGSYFLTFDTTGVIAVSEKSTSKTEWSFPTVGRVGVVVFSEYWGYNYNNLTFAPEFLYGIFYPDNEKTFCVKTPQTFYRTIYHHGKYMLYDYEIPPREDKNKKNKDNDKNKNLEKDPYVIAPPFNPTLNVEEVGVNNFPVYWSSKKFDGKTPLPNGEWFSETEKVNGGYQYYQKYGCEFNGNFMFGNLVFEDNQQAPQYTLNTDDLDKNGYPKPISYSQYETIGENATVYIKKYRIDTGFTGNPKNFTVIYNNGKFERKYLACRGTPPKIVYENGIPYISYNNKLINKYDPTSKVAEKLNLPDDTVYFPQSVWKEELKLQDIAVPYYVPSTEAIYRPGDHKAGVVGKGEPIISIGAFRPKEDKLDFIKESVPTTGAIYPTKKEISFVGALSAKSNGIYLSPTKDVYIKSDGKTKKLIDHSYNLEEFFVENKDVTIKFNKENVVIYRNSDFESLSDLIVEKEEKDLKKIGFPYYACYNANRIKYFIFDESKKLEEDCNIENYAKKTLEIDKKERLYYAYSANGNTYLLPQDYGICALGGVIRNQRYLPKTRKKGKTYERFDFLDYVCKGLFVEEETMYYAGVNGWCGKDVVDDYNRAIKFICNIKLADKLQELKIIYLQYCWDSYNMIHWEGNLGVQTYIRIEYTQILNGKEVGWKDLKFESSIYNQELDIWLIKPQTYSSLVDNFNYKQFEEDCQYRMRISGIDIQKNNINAVGSVVATPDFTIDKDAINPFVIEYMEFDPWEKRLKINFRVDDLQGDLYDITKMQFTTDGNTWEEINLGDVVGNVSKLNSNTLKNRETNQIITHTISWNLSSYINSSAEIRIQIYGTLSKYNVDFDYPHFSWVCWDNQKSKLAEDEENYILGNWVRYKQVIGKDGKLTWEELDTPVRQSGGAMETTNKKIEEINDKYEKTDKLQSYDEWLQSNYDGGITYASRIQALEQDRKDLQNRLNRAKRLRFEAELFTRKELIKQGFYCNGFINNDYKNLPFEYKVLNLPNKGHASTIDWGGEAEKITGLNGNLSELTSVVENIETLNALGFEIILPIPVGIGIDEESYPAKIEVVSKVDSSTNNVTNYLHISNSKIPEYEEEGESLEAKINVISTSCYSDIKGSIYVISNKETNFYFTLNNTYALGKYEIFFTCFSEKNNNPNKIKIYLERYSKEDNMFMECFVGEINISNKEPIKHRFYYNEENENIVEKLEYTRLVFKCSGNIYFTEFGVGITEITEEGLIANNLSNFIVKGKIGERKTVNSAKYLSDDKIDYEEKYTVYYRFQLDFSSDFNSQRFGVPLRDIVFARTSPSGELKDNEEEYSRIRGGKEKTNTFLVNKDVTNQTAPSVISEIEKIVEESKDIETETSILESQVNTGVTFDLIQDKKKFGNITIPKSDLPGEWNNKTPKKLNNSFPEVVDETKFESGLFNGNYYWRVAAYNVVECDYEEVSHSIINTIDIFKNYIIINLKCVSNENVESLSFNGNYWYKTTDLINPYWEFDWIKEKHKSNKNKLELVVNRGLVVFPTDAPRETGGNIITVEDSILLTPNSLDRTKPFVLKDNDELNYYMFYSKSSVFNQNVIVQSAGKSWDKFGELSQIYPSYILDKYTNIDGYNIASIFSPCGVFIPLKEQSKQKKIRIWATAQSTNKLLTVTFDSNIGKVDFDNPIICTGLDNTYHHSVIYENEQFVMVCCKTNSNKPCLYSYFSKDGLNWNELSGLPLLDSTYNISSPCINKERDKYKIYFTEWDGEKSSIVSYETEDFIHLNNKKMELKSSFSSKEGDVEITYKNPRNPCVIDDVYLGNEIKRLYYNVDMIFNNERKTVIKTMFLETGIWQKGIGKLRKKEDLSSSVFGVNNDIIIDDENIIASQEVRLEIELSDAYMSMPKECILQSDWINKDNYLEYGAVISPPRNFVYNTALKDKSYTGE